MMRMKITAMALLSVLTIASVAPAFAQDATMTKKEQKAERKAEKRERKMERRMDNMNNMNGGSMNGSMSMYDGKVYTNNTAEIQGHIDRANKALTDMVALLDQIEARKKAAVASASTGTGAAADTATPATP